MRRFFAIFLTICCFWLSAIWAQAQESISSFDVKIEARQNGDLFITETIAVDVKGRHVKRGILRELPRYQLYQGKEIPVRYKVRSVDRNDRREPFVIEKDGNAFVLRIGDADYFLSHEKHSYEISYLIKDDLRRTESADEVYWNVTGNYWRLPIDKASARVIVPQAVEFQSMDLYTGRMGQRGKDATFSSQHPEYFFQTTRPFAEGEGLTVSVRFNKGVFGPVQESTKRYIWWLRNGALILLSLSFLGIAGYYYTTWNRVGRDPEKGAVFPIYEPPEDYSPAAASYIYYRGIKDHKALIATLMGLATKNWIQIETDKRETVLTPLDRDMLYEDDNPGIFDRARETFAELLNAGDDDDHIEPPIAPSGEFLPLNAEEANLFARLFPKTRAVPIKLKKTPNNDFNLAHAAFGRQLQRNFGEPYYKVNIGYIMLGIAISAAAMIFTASQLSKLTPGWIAILFGALIAMNLLFIFLMPAPTKKGQKVRTELEGFRLFMKTAEKQKFDSVEVGSDRPPPMSVKRYEQLLPYAIALDVEEPWSRYFETVMPVEAESYNPHWSGSMRHSDIGRSMNSMVSNISSGVSSAAPQSSSSSGGGGGGFSGGGGGGGGGGGW